MRPAKEAHGAICATDPCLMCEQSGGAEVTAIDTLRLLREVRGCLAKGKLGSAKLAFDELDTYLTYGAPLPEDWKR
jgi:hypothetical protein